MVNGRITWSNGAPLDDGEVRLVPESGGTPLTTPVDSDGTYELIGVTAGRYTAEAIVGGDVLQERTITVSSGGTTTEDFVLLLAGAIDGEARWADLSGPVEGVEVEITNGAVHLTDTTGPLGQFGFADLTPGMWHLTATYDGDVILTGPISVPDGLTISVVLDVPVPAAAPETGTFNGTVTQDDDDAGAEQTPTDETGETTTVNHAGAPAHDSAPGSAPEEEAEEPAPSDPDRSNYDGLPQTGLSSDTLGLVLIAPLLLMLGLLTTRTARRSGVRRDLPE